MSEPRYIDGWLPEADFRRLSVSDDSDVRYRSIMRRSDGAVWCAPLGTPDPWSAEDADEWVSL